MFHDPILEAIPWVVAITGFVVAFLWIRRIVNDIEDN